MNSKCRFLQQIANKFEDYELQPSNKLLVELEKNRISYETQHKKWKSTAKNKLLRRNQNETAKSCSPI
jgi:hypothetical protein